MLMQLLNLNLHSVASPLHLCESEIVSAKVDSSHQVVLESIVVIVNRQIELVEASVTGWKASRTRIPVKTLVYCKACNCGMRLTCEH